MADEQKVTYVVKIDTKELLRSSKEVRQALEQALQGIDVTTKAPVNPPKMAAGNVKGPFRAARVSGRPEGAASPLPRAGFEEEIELSEHKAFLEQLVEQEKRTTVALREQAQQRINAQKFADEALLMSARKKDRFETMAFGRSLEREGEVTRSVLEQENAAVRTNLQRRKEITVAANKEMLKEQGQRHKFFLDLERQAGQKSVIMLRDRLARERYLMSEHQNMMSQTMRQAAAMFGIYGVASIAQSAFQGGIQGAIQTRTLQTYQDMVQRTNTNADEILNKIQVASRGTIDRMTAIGLSTQVLAQPYIKEVEDPAADIETMVRASRRFAQLYPDKEGRQEDTQAVFSKMVRYIREGNKELVDQWQISSQRIADVMNIPVAGLRGQEAAFDRYRGLLAILKEELARLGDGFGTAADDVERAQARMTNAWNSVSRNVLAKPSVGLMADAAAGLSGANVIFGGDRSTTGLVDAVSATREVIQGQLDQLEKAQADRRSPFGGDLMSDDRFRIRDAQQLETALIELSKAEEVGYEGADEYSVKISDLAASFVMWGRLTTGQRKELLEINKVVKDATEYTEEYRAKMAELEALELPRVVDNSYQEYLDKVREGIEDARQGARQNLFSSILNMAPDLGYDNVMPLFNKLLPGFNAMQNQLLAADSITEEQAAVTSKAWIDAALKPLQDAARSLQTIAAGQQSMLSSFTGLAPTFGPDAMYRAYASLVPAYKEFQTGLQASGMPTELQALYTQEWLAEVMQPYTDAVKGAQEAEQTRVRVANEVETAWVAAANAAKTSWESAASSISGQFSSQLEKIPGLLSPSTVTEEDMERAKEGVYTEKADEKLRQLEDVVRNKKEYPGVSLEDFVSRARAAGVAVPDEATDLGKFLVIKKAWEDLSFFANGMNTDLLNLEAARADLKTQEAGKSGRQAIMDLLGYSDLVPGYTPDKPQYLPYSVSGYGSPPEDPKRFWSPDQRKAYDYYLGQGIPEQEAVGYATKWEPTERTFQPNLIEPNEDIQPKLPTGNLPNPYQDWRRFMPMETLEPLPLETDIVPSLLSDTATQQVLDAGKTLAATASSGFETFSWEPSVTAYVTGLETAFTAATVVKSMQQLGKAAAGHIHAGFSSETSARDWASPIINVVMAQLVDLLEE